MLRHTHHFHKLTAVVSLIILMPLFFYFAIVKIGQAEAVSKSKFSLENLSKKGLLYKASPSNTLRYLAKDKKSIVLSQKPKNIDALKKTFFKDYGEYFGIKNYVQELSLAKTKIDAFGNKYLYFQQMYKGVAVYGGDIVLSVKPDLSVNSAVGNFLKIDNLNLKAKITELKAKENTKTYTKKQFGMVDPQIITSKKYIFNKSVLNNTEENKNYLVWKMEVFDQKSGGREFIFVNAQNGEVVYRYPGTKTLNREVCDCQSAGGCFTADKIACGNDLRFEGDPALGAVEADNLYDMLGQAHNYFLNTHNINGANKNGGTGNGSTNHPSLNTESFAYFIPTTTASWNCPNSVWNGFATLFCQGTVNYPVVGHEYGHSVNQNNAISELAYVGQSGQIEEAFADVWGQAVERYAQGVSSWEIGPNGAALWRNLKNLGNKPDSFYNSNYACANVCDDTNDYCYVHRNSTVISHMAYILSVGGELNFCNIEPIGQDKVERIFFETLTLITETTDFNALYGLMDTACSNLYGQNSKTCKQLRRAMSAAELDQGGRCSGIEEVVPFCRLSSNLNTDNITQNNQFNINNSSSTLPNIVIIPEEIKQPVVDKDLIVDYNNTQNTSTSTVIINPPITNIIIENVQEERVREPNFDITLEWKGLDLYLNGKINYYGKGDGCSGPRYYDPVIVRWGEGTADEPVPTNMNFNGVHTYKKTLNTKSYDLSVSVYSSCFGMTSKHITVTLPQL